MYECVLVISVSLIYNHYCICNDTFIIHVMYAQLFLRNKFSNFSKAVFLYLGFKNRIITACLVPLKTVWTGGGAEARIQLFQNMVMLHTKLKRMMHAAIW